MNISELLTDAAFAFILITVGSYVVHGILLRKDYANLGDILRAQPTPLRLMLLGLVVYLMLAVFFATVVNIFGAQGQGMAAAMVLLGVGGLTLLAQSHLLTYVTERYPGRLILKRMVLDAVVWLIAVLGIVFI